jgi:hypothetical protein
MKNELKDAIQVLAKALREDREYYEAWQANIAMAFKDNVHWYITKYKVECLGAEAYHEIANKSAEYFLNLLIAEQNDEAN